MFFFSFFSSYVWQLYTQAKCQMFLTISVLFFFTHSFAIRLNRVWIPRVLLDKRRKLCTVSEVFSTYTVSPTRLRLDRLESKHWGRYNLDNGTFSFLFFFTMLLNGYSMRLLFISSYCLCPIVPGADAVL